MSVLLRPGWSAGKPKESKFLRVLTAGVKSLCWMNVGEGKRDAIMDRVMARGWSGRTWSFREVWERIEGERLCQVSLGYV